ncbi:MAG: hypothetical protein K6B70_08180 [Clostridia bacterium]|nr:hypothetical protein [Clostridia bacterium]
MSIKEANEITLRVIATKEELFESLRSKGFKSGRTFSLDDYYFVPKDLDILNTSTRDIISKAIIIRDIINDGIRRKLLTYKNKEFDINGDILNQESYNCEILSIESAKRFIESIGYRQVLNIKENDIVFSKDTLELAIKDIVGGELLIEVETEPNTEFDTIEKLKETIKKLELPIQDNEFFVKKVEVELNKVLDR